MAERLADVELARGSNVSRVTFLEFITGLEALNGDLQEGQETVRSIRRRIKDLKKIAGKNGINVPQAERALDDSKRSGDEREADDRSYRTYMLFFAKPVGFQPSLDFDQADEGLAALNEYELDAIRQEGFVAGKRGDRRDRNPWSPGTETYAIWDSNWVDGQSVLAQTLADNPEATNGAANGTGRRRGRPRREEHQEETPAGADAEFEPLPAA